MQIPMSYVKIFKKLLSCTGEIMWSGVHVPYWNSHLSVLERCKRLEGMRSSPFLLGVDLCSPTVLITVWVGREMSGTTTNRWTDEWRIVCKWFYVSVSIKENNEVTMLAQRFIDTSSGVTDLRDDRVKTALTPRIISRVWVQLKHAGSEKRTKRESRTKQEGAWERGRLSHNFRLIQEQVMWNLKLKPFTVQLVQRRGFRCWQTGQPRTAAPSLNEQKRTALECLNQALLYVHSFRSYSHFILVGLSKVNSLKHQPMYKAVLYSTYHPIYT